MRVLLLSVLLAMGVVLLADDAVALSVEEAEELLAESQQARDAAASAVERHSEALDLLAARRARLVEELEAEQAERDGLLEHGIETSRSPRVMERVVERATERLEEVSGWLAETEGAIEATTERLARAEQALAEGDREVAASRRSLDGARLRASWAAGQRGARGLIWPTEGPKSSVYGMRRHPITGRERLHAGIDIPSPTGTPILAAEAGRVVSASALRGYGLTVIVDHGGGLTTLYAHVSAFEVVEGQDVEQGEVIARVGQTGMATGPHLHFEVRVDNAPVDPMDHF